ncbi:MAG TPA: hypothetical protein VJP89_08220 [Pyrinomonadaceae bacterium]|nr:hypothetical protein [Pyrinomonadaceae bacterium]
MSLNVRRFTVQEAMQKLHHQVRSRVEFAGIPRGTKGRVVELHELTQGQFDVVIEWDKDFNNKPLRDRFAKNTYERLLAEEGTVVA